ncbi:MAG: DUF3325 domain-containing protein [Pseudomonadota bacterium]
MIWGIAFILTVAGFSALCQSMQKHQRQIFTSPLTPGRSRNYRRLGTGLTIGAVVLSMARWGWDQGLVVSCGVATVAAVTVILILTFSPGMVRYLCWVPEVDFGAQRENDLDPPKEVG